MSLPLASLEQQLRHKEEDKAVEIARLQEQNRQLATEKERLAAEKEQLMKEREVGHQMQTSQRAPAQKEEKRNIKKVSRPEVSYVHKNRYGVQSTL